MNRRKAVTFGGSRGGRKVLKEEENNGERVVFFSSLLTFSFSFFLAIRERGESESTNPFMLLALRRLPLLRLASLTRTSRASRALSADMGSALGTPAEAQRRSTSESLPPKSIAKAASAAMPSSSSSPSSSLSSSPPFRLLESPFTDRTLLPNKTPLGEIWLRRREMRRRKDDDEEEKEQNRTQPLRPLDLLSCFLFPFFQNRRPAPAHRPRRPRPRVRGPISKRTGHHHRGRPRLRDGAQGASRKTRLFSPLFS